MGFIKSLIFCYTHTRCGTLLLFFHSLSRTFILFLCGGYHFNYLPRRMDYPFPSWSHTGLHSSSSSPQESRKAGRKCWVQSRVCRSISGMMVLTWSYIDAGSTSTITWRLKQQGTRRKTGDNLPLNITGSVTCRVKGFAWFNFVRRILKCSFNLYSRERKDNFGISYVLLSQ